MSQNGKINYDEWRKNATERMKKGEPKIVIQPSENTKRIRERWNKWRQNPIPVPKVQNPVKYNWRFNSIIIKSVIEKAEQAVQKGEKVLNENILKDFAIKWAESYEHGELYPDSFPRIAAQIGNERLMDAVADVVAVCWNEGLSYGTAFELRFDVFSKEFIQAVKAVDDDGLLIKHLQIYVNYRNLCDK
jgi:hypothetical protein